MRKHQIRICLECGEEFKVYRSNHIFCSVNCRVLNWKRNKKRDSQQLDLFEGDIDEKEKTKNKDM